MRHAKATMSDETKIEATKITRTIQKPSQTKEQSKLITQGIQKGIDLYKKQQKAKARELDRQRKKNKSTNSLSTGEALPENNSPSQTTTPASKLPWVLLLLSWLIFAAYVGY